MGPLQAPEANGVRLPAGFTSRVVARAGERPVRGSLHHWHGLPDGGAPYACEDGGWMHVSNSAMPVVGGVGMLRFNASGEVVQGRRLLGATTPPTRFGHLQA